MCAMSCIQWRLHVCLVARSYQLVTYSRWLHVMSRTALMYRFPGLVYLQREPQQTAETKAQRQVHCQLHRHECCQPLHLTQSLGRASRSPCTASGCETECMSDDLAVRKGMQVVGWPRILGCLLTMTSS